ncbi:MAG: zinc-binding dehydrogenase [Mycobacteriales bacterium]
MLGGAGKSGSLSLAAARRAGAGRLVGVVPHEAEAAMLKATGLADEVVVADARDPVALAAAVGDPVDVTVVCVDVPGCEHGAILATRAGGTVVFFSMATSFPAAALGAEGLAADVTMLIGNGYLPGHADLALELVRSDPGVRALFDARVETAPIPTAGSADHVHQSSDDANRTIRPGSGHPVGERDRGPAGSAGLQGAGPPHPDTGADTGGRGD